MERRKFLYLLLNGAGLTALALYWGMTKIFAAEMVAKITLSDKEWRNRLTTQQYDILRNAGTERAFTSVLVDEHRDGMFVCVGCDLSLFQSNAKFDSGTGWPSFFSSHS